MARNTAPLLSFGAGGQIGKTMVFASWRGVPYTRRYVVPANPNTDSQQATRGVFSWLNASWKLMAPGAQAAWTAYAKGKPLTDRNALIKFNLFPLRGTDGSPATDLSGFIASPGSGGGLAPASLTPADLTGHHLGLTLVAPSLPTDWTITKAHFLAFKQQDANSATFYTSYYAFDATSAYTADLDLGSAMTAAAYAWFEYMKPDGTTAFGTSL